MFNDVDGCVPAEYLNINMILTDYTISESYRERDDFKKYQKEQYFKFRQTIYNEKTLDNMIDEYMNYLKNSGAIERDSAKWENDSFEEECQNIKNYFKQRISVLDDYYGGL